MADTAHTVTARKAHRCQHHGYWCTGWIRPGEDYTRFVAFPGHDANGGDRPWVLRICSACKELTYPRRTRRAAGVQADRAEDSR